jgi:hypothetical protein
VTDVSLHQDFATPEAGTEAVGHIEISGKYDAAIRLTFDMEEITQIRSAITREVHDALRHLSGRQCGPRLSQYLGHVGTLLQTGFQSGHDAAHATAPSIIFRRWK